MDEGFPLRTAFLLIGGGVLVAGLWLLTLPPPFVPDATQVVGRVAALLLAFIGGSLFLFAGFRSPPAGKARGQPPRSG